MVGVSEGAHSLIYMADMRAIGGPPATMATHDHFARVLMSSQKKPIPSWSTLIVASEG